MQYKYIYSRNSLSSIRLQWFIELVYSVSLRNVFRLFQDMEKKRKFVETCHMLYRPHIMFSELIKVPAFNFTPGESGFPHKKSSLPLSLYI